MNYRAVFLLEILFYERLESAWIRPAPVYPDRTLWKLPIEISQLIKKCSLGAQPDTKKYHTVRKNLSISTGYHDICRKK